MLALERSSFCLLRPSPSYHCPGALGVTGQQHKLKPVTAKSHPVSPCPGPNGITSAPPCPTREGAISAPFSPLGRSFTTQLFLLFQFTKLTFKRFQKRLQESVFTWPFYPVVSSFTNISASSLKNWHIGLVNEGHPVRY